VQEAGLFGPLRLRALRAEAEAPSSGWEDPEGSARGPARPQLAA
jgi:hypothetical protein